MGLFDIFLRKKDPDTGGTNAQDDAARQEARIRIQVEKITGKDIPDINDDALLSAYVRKWKSTSIAYPALQKITSEIELVRIAEDEAVDRKLRIYALKQIKTEKTLVDLFRRHKGDWLSLEVKGNIKSDSVRYSLLKEFPGCYSPAAFSDPEILKNILKNHLYTGDSMDPFSKDKHEKASLYIRILETGNEELIAMLDKDECHRLADAFIKKADTTYAKYTLHVLKVIYRSGTCKDLDAEIEAMDGKTFNYINEINYYNEREYNPGIVFDLYGED